MIHSNSKNWIQSQWLFSEEQPEASLTKLVLAAARHALTNYWHFGSLSLRVDSLLCHWDVMTLEWWKVLNHGLLPDFEPLFYWTEKTLKTPARICSSLKGSDVEARVMLADWITSQISVGIIVLYDPDMLYTYWHHVAKVCGQLNMTPICGAIHP